MWTFGKFFLIISKRTVWTFGKLKCMKVGHSNPRNSNICENSMFYLKLITWYKSILVLSEAYLYRIIFCNSYQSDLRSRYHEVRNYDFMFICSAFSSRLFKQDDLLGTFYSLMHCVIEQLNLFVWKSPIAGIPISAAKVEQYAWTF